MNHVINTLMNHRSIRIYKEDPISDEQLLTVIKAAQAAPSSINGQQLSIIAIKDKVKKEKIAELTGGQIWISQAPVFLVFVADYYRAKLALEKNNEDLVITDNLESIMVSSVDIGLAMGNAIGAAESMGLGIVPIGAIRKEPKDMIELLNLPQYVYPVAGLVIGHPADLSAKKPRLPLEAVFHQEKYNRDLRNLIDEYDETISSYLKERTNGQEDRNWSQTISSFYNTVYFPKVSPTIKEQGFKNN